ncbi:HAD domain-containing protein [Mitsuaria sp. PDC51]|uniref:HAD domain-containing protein n=1 Tax=Mitsuaria sp. PDC51 TaxID=1881035 RepID=UPI001587D6DC
MTVAAKRPTVLLDVDDVLCPNQPFGGLHVFRALHGLDVAVPDLYEKLFAAQAVALLDELMCELSPRVVLTTSWLSLLKRPHFEHVFRRCGLASVADNFHVHWAAPTNRDESRLDAVQRWLRAHHNGEPFVILDDVESGESLTGSTLDVAGRVALCDATGCLQPSHLQLARRALQRPIYEPHSTAPPRD